MRFTPNLTQSQLDKGSAIIAPNPVQSIKSPKEASSRLKARLTYGTSGAHAASRQPMTRKAVRLAIIRCLPIVFNDIKKTHLLNMNAPLIMKCIALLMCKITLSEISNRFIYQSYFGEKAGVLIVLRTL